MRRSSPFPLGVHSVARNRLGAVVEEVPVLQEHTILLWKRGRDRRSDIQVGFES